MTFDSNKIVNAETLIDVEAKNAKDGRTTCVVLSNDTGMSKWASK